ncbi:hypothetical protein CLF_101920 [Clonorchis sinensis]|uniref:Uncharacterized protein n=1 Tax=Clonorchis sinensis TaxID=79923 RepID=G7Y6V6_CLOSI|nr:hypothetical protein CLF_101920 [Clonorchis sinensis]
MQSNQLDDRKHKQNNHFNLHQKHFGDDRKNTTTCSGVREELTNKEHKSFIANKRVQNLQGVSRYLKVVSDIDPSSLIGVRWTSIIIDRASLNSSLWHHARRLRVKSAKIPEKSIREFGIFNFKDKVHLINRCILITRKPDIFLMSSYFLLVTLDVTYIRVARWKSTINDRFNWVPGESLAKPNMFANECILTPDYTASFRLTKAYFCTKVGHNRQKTQQNSIVREFEIAFYYRNAVEDKRSVTVMAIYQEGHKLSTSRSLPFSTQMGERGSARQTIPWYTEYMVHTESISVTYETVAAESNPQICKARIALANLGHLWRQSTMTLNLEGRVYKAAINTKFRCAPQKDFEVPADYDNDEFTTFYQTTEFRTRFF